MYRLIPSFSKAFCRALQLPMNSQSFLARQLTLLMATLPGQMASMIWQQTAPEPSYSILVRFILSRSFTQEMISVLGTKYPSSMMPKFSLELITQQYYQSLNFTTGGMVSKVRKKEKEYMILNIVDPCIYLIIFTMSKGWTNITEQIFALSKQLDFLDMAIHPELSLEETMHAHEINDPKIDPKFDIQEDFTIQKMMQQGKVRPAKALSLKEIKNVYAEILRLQSLVLQGNPLPQTVYTFTYLYHDDLWKNSTLVAPLVESINTFGSSIYEIHKEACSVKEDDLSFSTFSFRKTVKTHDEVAALFLVAEKEVEGAIKAEKDASIQAEGKELLGLMKVRRSLHVLLKFLGKVYDNKLEGKISTEFKTARKRISEFEALLDKNKLKDELPEGVFSQTIYKTLRSHFGNRDVQPLTTQQALNELKNGLDQFELFMPVPTRITDFREKLNILSYKSLNLWAKAYIKYNLFQRESYLFNTVKTEEALVNDIKEWFNLTQDQRNDEKFENIIRLSSPSISENLYRMSGRNSRWFWEISKSYEDFNVMIHLGNELDGKYNEKKKQCYVSSWFYNFATTTMIRQILWGFEENLYEIPEYYYVAYQLEYILHINEKNNNLFHNKLDKAILESYYDGSLGKNKKKKKLLSEVEKKFLSESFFNKGLHYYFRSFHRLLVILLNKKLLSDPFEKDIELRFNNRFRIFKNVLFLKKLTHETYLKEAESLVAQEGKILEQASDLLKAAKNIFSLFSQFQDSETFYRQKEEAVILEKLCVKLSLVVITLKLKQPKKFSIKKEYPKFPEILIQ